MAFDPKEIKVAENFSYEHYLPAVKNQKSLSQITSVNLEHEVRT